jgi:fumarate reductase subunit C
VLKNNVVVELPLVTIVELLLNVEAWMGIMGTEALIIVNKRLGVAEAIMLTLNP